MLRTFRNATLSLIMLRKIRNEDHILLPLVPIKLRKIKCILNYPYSLCNKAQVLGLDSLGPVGLPQPSPSGRGDRREDGGEFEMPAVGGRRGGVHMGSYYSREHIHNDSALVVVQQGRRAALPSSWSATIHTGQRQHVNNILWAKMPRGRPSRNRLPMLHFKWFCPQRRGA
jgi:hypothetical protein